MTTRHHRPETPGLDFRLPPNITITLQALSNGLAYVFRDFELGELGRLVVEGTATGETTIVSEVAGDPADPMTARRVAMLEPLCRELTNILDALRSPGRDAPLPVRAPQPVGQVPCKEVRCETCGKIVAFLVFAQGATDDGRFEDYARLTYPHYAHYNVPTYILGPKLSGDRMAHGPLNILKVWPQRGPIECLLPEEFNPRINELATRHCP